MPNAPRSRREQGFLLIGVLSTILVLGILSGAVMQDWSIVEKREREAQLIFIQEQYASAITDYQKGQGALPTELEQLTKKGQKGELYLRHAYVDPMTRNAKLEDWCLLRMAAAGQVSSSCADTSGDGSQQQLGLGGVGDNERKADTGFNSGVSSKFKVGEEAAPPSTRTVPGVAPGGTGIVGVHSKSHDTAYNTVKRGEETYDRWYYSTEDFRKDISMRNIPGMPRKNAGPGLGKPGSGLNPGQPGSSMSPSSGRSGSRSGGSK